MLTQLNCCCLLWTSFLIAIIFVYNLFMIEEYLNYLSYPILDDHIFIESFIGSLPDSEMLKALEYILSNKKEYKVIVSIRENLIDDVKNDHILKKAHKLVVRNTTEYVKYIATSKYLINDVTFHPAFAKRDEQVYFNIWHGTPIKKLGFSTFENNSARKEKFTVVSNVNKNIRNADKIVVNNSHLENVFINEYGAKNDIISNSKILRTKYLKDSFFEEHRLNDQKENKMVIAYTWRKSYLENYSSFLDKLKLIDLQLQNSNTKVKGLVFIHHTMLNDDFISEFNSNIKNMEIVDSARKMEVLASSKYFLTDYSSLLFDAEKAGSKTLVDISEHSEYIKEVGVYDEVFESIKSPKLSNLNELANILNGDWNVVENDSFVHYEINDLNWVEQMLCYEKESFSNVAYKDLIYPGSLLTNGITSSFYNMLDKINCSKRPITLIVNLNTIDEIVAFEIRNKYSSEIDFIFIRNYFWNKDYGLKYWEERIIPYFKMMHIGRERFEKVIHYSGYDSLYALLFEKLIASEKIIYMHNDMELEYKFRKNFVKKIIFSSYEYFDKIICVSESLAEVAKNSNLYSDQVKRKISFIPNPLSSIEHYEKKAEESLDISKLKYGDECLFIEKFSNPSIKKISMLSRISYEKNNLVSIEAFEKYNEFNPDSILIMIGALPGKFAKDHNDYSKKVFKKMDALSKKGVLFNFEDINPFPIIKRTNMHLFMSKYEGQGLAPLEFAIFGVPTIGSPIPTNIEQSIKYGNIIISESDALKMSDAIKDNIDNIINFDLKSYNSYSLKLIKESIYD